MDRCALFVDAGYLLADGAMAVHGTRHREAVTWDYPGLLQLLDNLSRERTGLPLLRCYWYEATVEGRRTPEHDTLADLPGLKLRLSRIRPGRREGVDAQVHRDLMTLARNNAICDAVVVSGDEDLAQVVCDAQDLGIRVTVVHIAADGSWAVSRSLRQECDDLIEIGGAHLRPYVTLNTGASEAASPALSNGHHPLPPGSQALTSGSHPLQPSAPPPSLAPAPSHSQPPSHAQTHSQTPSHSQAPSLSPSPGNASTPPAGSPLPSAPQQPTGGHALPPAPPQQEQQSALPQGQTQQSPPPSQSQNGASPQPQQPQPMGGHHASPTSPTPQQPDQGATQSGMPSGAFHLTSAQPAINVNTPQQPPAHGSHHATGNGQSPSPQPPAGPPSGNHSAPPQQQGQGQHDQSALPAPLSYQGYNQEPQGQQTQQPKHPPAIAPTGPQYQGSSTYGPAQLGPYTGPQAAPVPAQATHQSGGTTTLADAVKAAHKEGHDFGESVARDAPALWLEAVLARKPRMPSDLEARLLQGSSLPIDFLLHDEVRHALRRGFWDALERARR
ncbi:uncharacterized LabA/DUF88 family protein [Thermocatellispora tengchongensis]|uniref:Uncharacterized LabA/DUF88 family protein n=1 Tax=Thermocatellispora tengchongensis TaxID=1073253 RepID=A0A840NZ14_9ACTN|nr:NYN domain-containing protein [Thermocatellispora tengchongensis]MBB5130943.1 uncharacterized LabA/DUF88 family protein [Thermocatellispora tengchongensis]